MTALATDNFNRANNASLGANWTMEPGTGPGVAPQIVANQVEAGTTNVGFGESYYNAVTWPNDQYSQAVIVAATGGSKGFTGVSTRVSSSADTHYFTDVTNPGASCAIEIAKHIAVSFTQLASGTVTFNANDTLKLQSQGSTHKAFRNGITQLLSTTDSAITSGSAGIAVDPDFGSALTDSILDTWEGGDLSGGAPQRSLTGVGR